MLSIIFGSAVALTIAGVLMRTHRTRSSELRGQRNGTLLTAVQIVCGDCAGEGERPIRTCLDESARCERCGGTSYVLASELAVNSIRLRAARVRVGARVLAFEARLPGRREAVSRVAV